MQRRQMTFHSRKKMNMNMSTFIIISALCVSVSQLSSVQASAAPAPAPASAETVQQVPADVSAIKPEPCTQRVSIWNDERNDTLNIDCRPTDNPSGPQTTASLSRYRGNFFFNPPTHDAEAVRWTCVVDLVHVPACLKFTAWADEQHQSSLLVPCHFCAYKVSTVGVWINTNACQWRELPDWQLLAVKTGQNCGF